MTLCSGSTSKFSSLPNCATMKAHTQTKPRMRPSLYRLLGTTAERYSTCTAHKTSSLTVSSTWSSLKYWEATRRSSTT